MPITIGEKTLATRKPRDLDKQLVAATGCGAAEMPKVLAGSPLAGIVARALKPFLGDDAPSLQDLTDAIAAAGVAGVAADVRALFGAAEDAPADGETAA